MSTHIGLVARAFGADELILTGADDRTADSIRGVGLRWGGDFKVRYQGSWREVLRDWEGLIIHLTMYGERLDDVLPDVRRKIETEHCQVLVVVGAEKVPRDVYNFASYNVAIGNQPHSEVAALAVFLDRLFMGEELNTTFGKARIKIKPRSRGKEVEVMNETGI
jgi:tRNA (cytidine56-2'-O)-methyltransferase